MSEEHDSIFAKLKGTDEWKPAMFEKISKNVLATVEYDDGRPVSEILLMMFRSANRDYRKTARKLEEMKNGL